MRLDYNKSRKFTLKPPGLVLEDMGRLTQRRNVPSFTFLECNVHSCNTQTMKCTKLKVQLEGLFHMRSLVQPAPHQAGKELLLTRLSQDPPHFCGPCRLHHMLLDFMK